MGLASPKTNYVKVTDDCACYPPFMLSARQLLDTLALRGVTQAEMARALNLPGPRISEMYAGKRQIRLDEGKRLVEAFGIDEAPAVPPLSEATARLLILYVANQLGLPITQDDPQVSELTLDFQAFSRFARAHLPAPSPEATTGFLAGRSSDRGRSTAT